MVREVTVSSSLPTSWNSANFVGDNDGFRDSGGLLRGLRQAGELVVARSDLRDAHGRRAQLQARVRKLLSHLARHAVHSFRTLHAVTKSVLSNVL